MLKLHLTAATQPACPPLHKCSTKQQRSPQFTIQHDLVNNTRRRQDIYRTYIKGSEAFSQRNEIIESFECTSNHPRERYLVERKIPAHQKMQQCQIMQRRTELALESMPISDSSQIFNRYKYSTETSHNPLFIHNQHAPYEDARLSHSVTRLSSPTNAPASKLEIRFVCKLLRLPERGIKSKRATILTQVAHQSHSSSIKKSGDLSLSYFLPRPDFFPTNAFVVNLKPHIYAPLPTNPYKSPPHPTAHTSHATKKARIPLPPHLKYDYHS
jgi:hypothetical protein